MTDVRVQATVRTGAGERIDVEVEREFVPDSLEAIEHAVEDASASVQKLVRGGLKGVYAR